MKILHIEEWSPAADVLIHDLHAGTGCSIERAATIEEGLRKIEQAHGTTDVVLYTVTTTSSDALAFPEQVRAMATGALFRCPRFILLASAPLPLPCAAKCIDWQVVCLLREYPKQTVETVRALLWKIRSSKPGPTIRIEFRHGHYRFFICGPTTSEEIVVSKQIGKLLLLLLGGTRTVDDLADELDVLPRSVKTYVWALRHIIGSLLERMNMAEFNMDIVWMRKGPGGTICGLRANPVWG